MRDVSFPPALWSIDADTICQGAIENCQQGVVTFDGQKGAELEITFGELVDTTIKEGGGRADIGPKHVDALYAFSRDGRYIVLRDVTAYSPGFSVPGGTHQSFHAGSMLVSRRCIWQEPLIQRLRVDIPGLREWINRNPVKHFMKREDEGSGFSYTYDSSETQPVVLYNLESALIQVVRMVNDQSWNQDKGSFSIDYRCCLEIIFHDSLPTLDEAVGTWVIPMWEFLCFCMGIRPSIEDIGFMCCDGTWGNLYQPFTGIRVASGSYDYGHMPLPYNYFEDDIDSVIKEWLELDGDAKRAATSLVSLLDEWRMPLNLIFISCACSFEALSRVGVDVYRLDEDELERRLGIVEASIEERKIRDWARSGLENRRRKDAGVLARELIKRIKDYSDYVTPNREKFLTDHRGWRNNYIHQNELTVEQQDMQALWVHTWSTWLLCYGAIANLIGIPPKELVKRLEKSWFMNDRILASRERYADE